MDLSFEKTFTVFLFAMKGSRTHPDENRNKLWVLQLFIMNGVYTVQYFVVAYNFYLALVDGDYTELTRNGIVSVVYSLSMFQSFILLVKKGNIKKMINMMKADYSKKWPEDEKAIMLKYAKKGSSTGYQWFSFSLITGALFPIKYLITEVYLYIIGEFEWLMIYSLIFPSPIEEHKMDPVVYTISNLVQFFYLGYTVVVYTSFIPLGPSFMLHACGQLEIVSKRALELYANNPSEEETKVKVIDIVKQLQYIYEFVEYINDTFSVIYEITMKGTTFLLPITAFHVLEKFQEGEVSVEFILFIIDGAFVSSIPCYFSDMLMEKGYTARLAIYSCNWERVYDHGTRTTIMLMLQRALRPCVIRTMFRTMNLDTLTDLFQQSYALFNLMNAAWD